jgi:hypothetical protein
MILIVLMVTPLDIYKQNMEKVLLKIHQGDTYKTIKTIALSD